MCPSACGSRILCSGKGLLPNFFSCADSLSHIFWSWSGQLLPGAGSWTLSHSRVKLGRSVFQGLQFHTLILTIGSVTIGASSTGNRALNRLLPPACILILRKIYLRKNHPRHGPVLPRHTALPLLQPHGYQPPASASHLAVLTPFLDTKVPGNRNRLLGVSPSRNSALLSLCCFPAGSGCDGCFLLAGLTLAMLSSRCRCQCVQRSA